MADLRSDREHSPDEHVRHFPLRHTEPLYAS